MNTAVPVSPVALVAALRSAGVEPLVDRALGPLTTYRCGGAAAVFVEVDSPEDLVAVAAVTARLAPPVLVIGKGSNLLVADGGFDGVAVQLVGAFLDVRVDGTTVVAGGGASLPVVARRTVAAGLTGFEWAVGVPGSIGGAVRMNAGGHGSDMAAVVRRVRVVDLCVGNDVTMAAGDLGFAYRGSRVRPSDVVAEVELALDPGDVAAGEATLASIVRWRREHQPGGHNAGSVFTNPPGDSAGRLIDAAGCRGLRLGSAEVSTKHANFIQVDEGGSAADVIEVMAAVRARVIDRFDVELHAETRLVGFDDEVMERVGARQ
ncbi:MAG TPA: UDP-N-acetylmuramate dehydrogenase [Microthrixaceae bacterium]|nr:UDP-N-acetylmuramate dehydrogenase [Microthrixaceae bacterium]HMT25787.1 UDP-N-acetylmuramate dehydrogenase [Microthrixaceae bacterium]